MDRAVAVLIALAGLGAVVFNRRFGRSSVTSSREFFGRELREGSREYRFMVLYSRVIAVVVGSLMFLAGTLDLLGISWRD